MRTKESLYCQCSSAIDRLVENPPRDHGGVFSEIDVISEAATSAWKQEDYRQALHEANAVCGTQYRNRKLCRYGPVVLADGTEDFARIAGKIVYANAETGPEFWDTPNGKFPRLMIEDDSIGKQGRKAGTDRNDAESWEQHEDPPRRIAKRKASEVRNVKDEKELRKFLETYLAMVDELQERVEELETKDRKRDNAMREMITA